MIASLLKPQFMILYLFAACAVYVHFRGRERLRLGRQLADHSTIMAPYNVLMYMFSATPNAPVLSTEKFPELRKLRDNWQVIREEAVKLFDEGRIRAATKNNDWGFHSFFKSGWKRFYLKWYEDFLPSARATCPKTVELLNSIPSVHGAMFALLPPGAKLGNHRDPFAGSLRYHLGLVTPNSNRCHMFVDGVECVWRDGEDFLFDETFIHRAENTTDQTRIILFCDVERPMKYRFMTAINRWVSNHLVKAAATDNVEGERVGVINRAFTYLYEVNQFSRRIKAWNYRAYYVMKFSIVGAVLAVVFVSAFR
jgi:beta-hydroxylase